MHRTQGDGFVLESGLRRFVDQNLPATPGTVHPAEWDNAVQEELCYVITAAGLTVASTALADRTAGWHQLYDAIFDSEAIDTGALADGAVTNDKITSCGFSKLVFNLGEGGIDVSYISVGTTFSLELSPASMIFKGVLSPSVESCIVDRNSISIKKELSSVIDSTASLSLNGFYASDWVTYSTVGSVMSAYPVNGFEHTYNSSGIQDTALLSYNGLSFIDGDRSAGETIRFRVIDLDGATWTGSGPYTTTVATFLNVSDDAPLTAMLRYRSAAGNVTIASSLGSTNYKIIFVVNGSNWDAQITIAENITGSYDQRKLIVWYG